MSGRGSLRRGERRELPACTGIGLAGGIPDQKVSSDPNSLFDSQKAVLELRPDPQKRLLLLAEEQAEASQRVKI